MTVHVALGAVTGTVLALAMDPTVVGASIVLVVGALAAGVVAILQKLGENQKAARDDAAEAAAAAAQITIELAKIGHSVDGAASKSVNKIDMLEQRVEQLIRQLAEEKNTASTLAAHNAGRGVSRATDQLPAKAGDKKILQDIEQNTAETAVNTAKETAAVVQALETKTDKP